MPIPDGRRPSEAAEFAARPFLVFSCHPPALMLVVFALLALAWNLLTPVFEAPDESTHFFVALHIVRTGTLPVQTLEIEARGPWEQEGSQPPLYYALVAPLVRAAAFGEGSAWDKIDNTWIEARINPQNSMGDPAVVGNDNRFVHGVEAWPWPPHVWAVRLARLVSTLLGLVAVAATWALASRVFGVPGGLWLTGASNRRWLALAATALFALNPQILAAFSALSNDPAIITLAALALWLLARLWDGQNDRPTVAALAFVVGLAPLAKVSGLALVAFSLATVAWLALGSRAVDGALALGRGRGLAWGLRVGGAIVAAVLLLSGWWYLRNLQLYGSLTGLNYMLPEGVGRELNWERWLRGLPAELLGIWRSSWGLFGWFTLPLPAWSYAIIDAATAAAAASLVWAGWRGARGERVARDHEGEPQTVHSGANAPTAAVPHADGPRAASSAQVAAVPFRPPWSRLLWLALWWGLMFAALLRWLLLVKGGHGRLLFPAWAAVALALVVGWRALLPRAVSDRALALAVSAAMLALATGALLGVIRPAFALAPTIAEAEIPATATRVDAVFGAGLRLLAVEHPERVVEGELLPVTLYWRVEGDVRRPGLVALRLDPMVANTGETTNGGWSASATGHRAEIVRRPSEAYLAYPGAGMVPFSGLSKQVVHVDRHRVPVPDLQSTLASPGTPFVRWDELDDGAIALADSVALSDTDETSGADGAAGEGEPEDGATELLARLGPGADGPGDPARRYTMPIEARLSIHVYDRDAAEAWPLQGADAAVGALGESAQRTDVERRVVIDRGRGGTSGDSISGAARSAATFGSDPTVIRMGWLASVTRGSLHGQDTLFVAGSSSPEVDAGRRGDPGDASGDDPSQDDPSAPASLALIRHIVPHPREQGITWSATRVAWSVERAPERDLAAFVHLVDEEGAVVATFDGDPVTHGAYPSSRWRRGDVLVADLGWRIPDAARPGDRFTLLVGLYERVEGAPRLPAFDPRGERFANDAVPLVDIEVGRSSGGPLRPDGAP